MKRIISLVVLVSSIALAQSASLDASRPSCRTAGEAGSGSAISISPRLTRVARLAEPQARQEAGQQYGFQIQNPTSNIQYPGSSIQHQVSSTKYPASSIQLQSSVPQKKSPGLAILYSMILPGMGELYADAYDSGKYFTIADGALWGTFTGFTLYGDWKRNNYISFAKTNAGINLDGMESDFIANVSIYMSTDDYNRIKELNREFSQTYNASNYKWNWESNDKRKEFRDMWSSSEGAYNKVRFVVGALLLNRIVSAINAVRLVSAYNRNLPQELSWNVYFGVEDKPTLPQTFTFNFTTRF
ncbi:MAG: hypothetical protein Q8L04_03675 [Ignavibacteria bacterium]|nr:hypothetical protein [Ignavibacteria bacterium]